MLRLTLSVLGIVGILYAVSLARNPAPNPPNPAPRPAITDYTLTPLTPTPRSSFRPSNRKGYWNIDVVDDFTLPASKALIFCGAGRNLHVDQDWSKLFRRGFSAIDHTRMVPDKEFADDPARLPKDWKSRLQPGQRSQWLTQGYFAGEPFRLEWARNSEAADNTPYRLPQSDRNWRQTLFQASMELCGSCVGYGDCPPGQLRNTNGFVILDIENEGISAFKQQEQANLFEFLRADR